MQVSNPTTTLNRDQLRDITLDDEELMREILAALVDDTTRQMRLLATAIEERDSQRCMRLAHYSKGACANVGANAAATVLKNIERQAASGNFEECHLSMAALENEVTLLLQESQTV